MDIGKIYKVVSTELGIGEVPQIGREGEIERGREREMDIGKICEVVSAELGIGEVPQIGREGEIERGPEREMDIRRICEIVSMELGKEKVCEAVLAEINIEKVQEALSAHYKDLTEDQKQPARILFETMDKDKSGDISIDELMVFLGVAGFQNNEHDWLFAELDKDNNASLDFKELATFFHVLNGDDEYKHLLNCWASTDLPDRKGRKWNEGDFARLYDKLKRAYRVAEWENDCSIV